MTNNQLKAELAQALAENKRLRDGLALCFSRDPLAENILQTPPTSGIGAAMLRVVEAAKALASEDIHDAEKQWGLIMAVSALKKLEME